MLSTGCGIGYTPDLVTEAATMELRLAEASPRNTEMAS